MGRETCLLFGTNHACQRIAQRRRYRTRQYQRLIESRQTEIDMALGHFVRGLCRRCGDIATRGPGARRNFDHGLDQYFCFFQAPQCHQQPRAIAMQQQGIVWICLRHGWRHFLHRPHCEVIAFLEFTGVKKAICKVGVGGIATKYLR